MCLNYLQMVPQQCYLERRYPNRSFGKLEALADGPPKQPKDLADFEVKTIQSNTNTRFKARICHTSEMSR